MLNYVPGRVIVRADPDGKNYHTFLSTGKTIRLEREYGNLNCRETQQVMGEVVSAENIPEGATVLFHHNSLHPTNEIFNHQQVSGEAIAEGAKMYSLPESDLYFWKQEGESWQPTSSYATAKRVFKPYAGLIDGIPPTLIKDVLYVNSGRLEGLAVKTLAACDYEIVFRGESGVEEHLIRFRPDGDPIANREPEAICILHDTTDKILNGDYWVGYAIQDAAPLQTTTDAIQATPASTECVIP